MIAALALILVHATQPPSCDLNLGVITGRSIGPLRTAEPTRELRRRCTSVRDTVVTIPMADWADTVSALTTKVRGASVLAFVEKGRVHALRVSSAGPITTDGLGVGTSISRFRLMKGVRISASDHSDAVVLTITGRCGLSFFLSGWGPTPVPEDGAALQVRQELDHWPESIHVTSVLVYGC
jgi:hypothetical protein